MESKNNPKIMARRIGLRFDAEELAALDQFSKKHGINRASLLRIGARKIIENPEILLA